MGKKQLHHFLNDIFKRYHDPSLMRLDPLVKVRAFSGKKQLEIAGLMAASLSYGRVEQICRSVQSCETITGKDIYKYTTTTSYSMKKKDFLSFKHRFNTGTDIALLLESVKRAIRRFGSLERLFFGGSDPDHRLDIGKAIHTFSSILLSFAHEINRSDAGESFRFLLPSPLTGSTCKRFNLYLRWMIRPDDGIDLGIWDPRATGALVIPLDIHMQRITRTLSLLKRKSIDWHAAEEITRGLREIDPADPVRFDFSLCHYGMLLSRKEAGRAE